MYKYTLLPSILAQGFSEGSVFVMCAHMYMLVTHRNVMLIPVHTTVKLALWKEWHCLAMKVLRRAQGVLCDLDG